MISPTLTAEMAFDRYKTHFEEGRLIQSGWHSKDADGRELACGLGALDPKISSASDCPASVMPSWLAELVLWFFDTQEPEDAFAWGLPFYAELKRLGGAVPLTVLHDWEATVVLKIGLEWAEEHSKDIGVHKALADFHAAAATGQKFSRDAWFNVLHPTLEDIYSFQYKGVEYAESAFAEAETCAEADADQMACAITHSEPVDIDAYVTAYDYAAAIDTNYRTNIKRMADGMVDCLARVAA